MHYISKTSEETKNIGKEIAASLRGGEVLCLYGDLGYGKTTFVAGLINHFLPQKRVLSPTFIIVRHYQIKNKKKIRTIYHFDLYRISKPDEAIELGLPELFNKKNSVVIIEWAEKIANVLPKKRTDIYFTMLDENERKIIVRGYE